MPTLLSAHCRRYYTHPQPPATEPLEPPSRRRTSPPCGDKRSVPRAGTYIPSHRTYIPPAGTYIPRNGTQPLSRTQKKTHPHTDGSTPFSACPPSAGAQKENTL